MSDAFIKKPLGPPIKGGFKLFNKKPDPNTIIEINNLLASKEINKIGVSEIQKIVFKYRVNLKRHFLTDIKGFYQQFFEHCLDDHYLSDEEMVELRHLKRILTLNDREVDEIHNTIAGNVYQKAVDEVLEDSVLDPEEKAFLEKLQKDLRLDSKFADKLYKEKANEILQKLVDEALEDVLLTPEEEAEIAELSKNLDIEFAADEHTQQELEKYKLFWQIENGDMPELKANIELDKGEKVHFRTQINWMAHEPTGEKMKYRGAEMNEKIANGIYWKMGKLGENPIEGDDWNVLDEGKLYITNKRLIFIGNGEAEIPLEYISDFSAFSNGIEVQMYREDTDGFFNFERNIDLFCMILGNAIMMNENGFSDDGSGEE
ncbi:MAG: hypothetical protein AB8B61_03220 [Cyclobacteriaceae bacterium]